ncbi:MAG TPA: ABC transporter permease [Thermoplasmata archaeon]|jgi:ABC-2 type transport system permease protein
MNLGRVLSIARKNLRVLKHDRRTVGFIVLMPLLMITIFGYAFGGEVQDIKVHIVDLDSAPSNESISARVISSIQSRDTLRIVALLDESAQQDGGDPVATSTGQVEDAEIWATIVFDVNFTADVTSRLSSGYGAPVPVQVIVDGTNPNIVQAIVVDLQKSIAAVLAGMGAVPVVTISVDYVYGEGASFIDFFAPGVMSLAAMLVTFMLSIVSFVRERGTATMDRLLTTPVTESEIVVGHAISYGLVALMQSIVIILTAVLLFQVQIVGNVLLVLFTIFLLGLGMLGVGMLLSSFARSEFQAVQFMPIILFPSILLAGVFWPIEAIPEFLRPVSYFIPMTYAVAGCRSVMIRGWGIGDVWMEITILALFACVTLASSTYGLKRRR